MTAVAALCALSSTADARVRAPAVSPECNISMPCVGVDNPVLAQRSQQEPKQSLAMLEPTGRGEHARRAVEPASASEGYSSGLVGPLQAKLASIQAACP